MKLKFFIDIEIVIIKGCFVFILLKIVEMPTILILLINDKMPKFCGVLTIMSRINAMLSVVKHENSFFFKFYSVFVVFFNSLQTTSNIYIGHKYAQSNISKCFRSTHMHLNNRCSNAKQKTNKNNTCSTIIESTPLKGANAPNMVQL